MTSLTLGQLVLAHPILGLGWTGNGGCRRKVAIEWANLGERTRARLWWLAGADRVARATGRPLGPAETHAQATRSHKLCGTSSPKFDSIGASATTRSANWHR